MSADGSRVSIQSIVAGAFIGILLGAFVGPVFLQLFHGSVQPLAMTLTFTGLIGSGLLGLIGLAFFKTSHTPRVKCGFVVSSMTVGFVPGGVVGTVILVFAAATI